MKFSTKAGTLNSLRDILKTALIPDSFFFTVREWELDRVGCLNQIKDKIRNNNLIVRSSCKKEDTDSTTNAGQFLSIPNISLDQLERSVERVIASYISPEPDDEILVQNMLSEVTYSGVAFSHDPNTCSPYRVINWTESRDTSLITGGFTGRMWKQAALSPTKPPKLLKPVVNLIDELLSIFKNRPLDIEFAITMDGDQECLWLLQVRQLILPQKPESEVNQKKRLQLIAKKIKSGMNKNPFLMGKTTVYGVMPDWNPAEIIGIRPKPLALSLYRELVTDNIWAYQRHNYGYRNLRSFPLMLHFFGLPYIDVRVSFNSFIPARLSPTISQKLVDFYIHRLLQKPTLHDKVEFEIVFSCYTLDLPDRLKVLSNHGFSRSEITEIEEQLRKLTNNIINPLDSIWRQDTEKIKILNERRNILLGSDLTILDKIYWLQEDTKRYGTLPFAGMARAGFIAIQMLKSFVAKKIFSEKDYQNFFRTVNTITGTLSVDQANFSKSKFLEIYGHLRPGTYDITSYRYDQKPNMYFDWSRIRKPPEVKKSDFILSKAQEKKLKEILSHSGLAINPTDLLEFIRVAIEQRELSKFHFTRNLSDMLNLMTEYGKLFNLSSEELSYSDINVFKDLYLGAEEPKVAIKNNINYGKKRYKETLLTSLPPIIMSHEDVWGFEVPETEPNFITQKKVTAPVSKPSQKGSLSGSIVCIQSADPGYDWLFSHKISGLITTWGGANSHMAIRAGELGLPAVIGAGEALYKLWSGSKLLHIDCSSNKVEVIR